MFLKKYTCFLIIIMMMFGAYADRERYSKETEYAKNQKQELKLPRTRQSNRSKNQNNKKTNNQKNAQKKANTKRTSVPSRTSPQMSHATGSSKAPYYEIDRDIDAYMAKMKEDNKATEPFPGLQAMYLRPEKLTIEDTELYFKNMKKWGVDELFLEIGYNNRVLNHSDIFPAMDPETDWLKVYSEKAREYGIKIHIWTKICYWLNSPDAIDSFPILKEHPDWIDLNRDGKSVGDGANWETRNFVFVNPAVPGVLDAITKYIDELAAYDIDGISIDYIRFKYAGDDFKDWYGHNPYSVELFKKRYNIDPKTIEYDLTSGSDFMKWTRYNENVIRNCVKNIYKTVRAANKKHNKSIILSASPFSTYKSGKSSKFQKWKPWDLNGYIQLWLPMCMSTDMQKLCEEFAAVKDMGLNSPYIPVIYPNQHGSLHPPLKDHYEAILESGIESFAVFQYKQLAEEFEKKDKPDNKDKK